MHGQDFTRLKTGIAWAIAATLLAVCPAQALDVIYPANSGFELPNLGAEPASSYKYWNELSKDQLGAAAWTFTGSSGIAANGSFFNVSGADNANGDGTKSAAGQAAFITGKGSVSQKFSLPPRGKVFLSFKFASRGNQDKEADPIEVRVDEAVVETFTPKLAGGFVACHLALGVNGGTHTISFVGTNATGDPTTFLDDVKFTVAAEGESLPSELTMQTAVPPEVRAAPGDLPLPLQPLTVELLDLYRGKYTFTDALGQTMELAGPVRACCPGTSLSDDLRIAYLCCDPEFPDDPAHAELKLCQPFPAGEAIKLGRIDEPYFQADVTVQSAANGALGCELKNLVLGAAKSGERYVAAVYLLSGTHYEPLWLVPPTQEKLPLIKLGTRHVGNVFCADEAITLEVDVVHGEALLPKVLALRATNYASGEEVWIREIPLHTVAGKFSRTTVDIPLKTFGVFRVDATGAASNAELRVTEIPEPRRIQNPENATVGMNIFQQEIWWYAYQSPLLAKAGVHWIRPWLNTENVWPTVEPHRGQWDTRALDASLRRMSLAGQSYECILFGCPAWVSTPGSRIPVGKFNDWNEYVEHLVSQYKGRIKHFETWNEPDDPRYQKSDPSLGDENGLTGTAWYLKLLETTWVTAKKANPDVIIDGISHAGFQSWLRTLSDTEAAKFMDVATMHSYTPAAAFAKDLRQRQGILEAGGWGNKPIWTNEFGSPAYDFSTEYSKTFDCSEKGQAIDLTQKYAQALALGRDAKAFWFCSYDPRDSAHPAQATGDSAIGVLYQGFLPKLSYAALAAVSQELDGRACIGQTQREEVTQVSFDGLVSVAWLAPLTNGKKVKATQIGCGETEQIVVKDLFANRVASGAARDVSLDFSDGPLYIEGSKQLAALAKAAEEDRAQQALVEAPIKLSHDELSILPGQSAQTRLTLPKDGTAKVAYQSPMPVTVELRNEDGGLQVVVMAKTDAERASGNIALEATTPGSPRTVKRNINVEVGTPSLIRNGSVSTDDFGNWTLERNSCFIWDGTDGHNAPGCMEIIVPFDGRIRQNVSDFKTDRDAKFSFWIKGPVSFDGTLRMVLACFGKSGDWVGDVTLASNDARVVQGTKAARITMNPGGWSQTAMDLDHSLLPGNTASVVFYIDAKGAGKEPIRLDDIDLWQP